MNWIAEIFTMDTSSYWWSQCIKFLTFTEHTQTEHMHHYHCPHDFDVLAEAKELKLFTLEGILAVV